MKITLDLPTSLNRMYRTKRNSHGVYKTMKAKKYHEKASWEINQAFNSPLEACEVSATLFFPDLRYRDLDNYVKLVSDSLTASGIIEDDNWRILRKWTIEGDLDRENPRIELEIKEVEKHES